MATQKGEGASPRVRAFEVRPHRDHSHLSHLEYFSSDDELCLLALRRLRTSPGRPQPQEILELLLQPGILALRLCHRRAEPLRTDRLLLGGGEAQARTFSPQPSAATPSTRRSPQPV